MARYQPKLPIRIAEACNETWEVMDGNSRVRHCATCDHDVLNTSAMTPTQIDAMLAGDGPQPCLRLAQFADGSLLVAEEMRPQPRFGPMAGVTLATLVSISAAGVAAQSGRLQAFVGRKPVPQAVYSGTVLGTDGKPAPGSLVYVSRILDGKLERVKTFADAQGSFHLQATPGEWTIFASSQNGPAFAKGQPLTLRPGEQSAPKPLMLLEELHVTMGIMLPPPRPIPRPGK